METPKMSAIETRIDGISVVVPCFNSGKALNGLVREILETCHSEDLNVQVVLVDDASSDDTWSEISKLSNQFRSVEGVHILKNAGQHFALAQGIIRSKFEVVVTLDDDGQNPPSEIPKMIRVLEGSKVDLVYGSPIRRGQTTHRKVLGRAFRRLIALASGEREMIRQSNFRAFRRILMTSSTSVTGTATSVDAILLSRTSRIATVSVVHKERGYGRSGYRLKSLVRLGVTVFGALSKRVLVAVFLSGISLSGVALVVSILYGALAVANPDRFPGFTSLAVILLLAFSLQVALIGVLGIFIARVLESLPSSPQPAIEITEVRR